MTRTFEEMCAERDPLYAELEPHGDMSIAIYADKSAVLVGRPGGRFYEFRRDAALLTLAIKALKRARQS
jgi:hypothetical protein